MTSAHTEERGAMAEFLDPGFNLSSDTLTSEESSRYLAWCSKVHGEGDLSLVPFAEFYVECDPRGLKGLRRHTAAIKLPISAAVMMWMHTYCVLGSPKGTLYELIAIRELGGDRADVIDVLRCAGYVGGPFSLNAAGELSLPYLRRWQGEADKPSTLAWPEGWASNPNAFRSGIDHAVDDLPEAEYEMIANWYQQVHGEMPSGLAAAAAANPRAFKLARVRFERLVESDLPAQVFPLLLLHTAVVRDQQLAARRAAQLATSLGIGMPLLAEVVHWGSVLGGEAALERGMGALEGLPNEH